MWESFSAFSNGFQQPLRLIGLRPDGIVFNYMNGIINGFQQPLRLIGLRQSARMQIRKKFFGFQQPLRLIGLRHGIGQMHPPVYLSFNSLCG